MASLNQEDNRKEDDSNSDSHSDSNSDTAQHLKPFDEASAKFVQAIFNTNLELQAGYVNFNAEYQEKVRKIEALAQQSVIEANKQYVELLGEIASKPPEQIPYLSIKAQMEHENKLRQIHLETHAQVQKLDKKGAPLCEQYNEQGKQAFEGYLADLKQAWSNIDSVEPTTLHAIASSMLSTIHSVSK